MKFIELIIAPLLVIAIVRLVVVERKYRMLKEENQKLVNTNAKLVSENEVSVREKTEEIANMNSTHEKEKLGVAKVSAEKAIAANFAKSDEPEESQWDNPFA